MMTELSSLDLCWTEGSAGETMLEVSVGSVGRALQGFASAEEVKVPNHSMLLAGSV